MRNDIVIYFIFVSNKWEVFVFQEQVQLSNLLTRVVICKKQLYFDSDLQNNPPCFSFRWKNLQRSAPTKLLQAKIWTLIYSIHFKRLLFKLINKTFSNRESFRRPSKISKIRSELFSRISSWNEKYDNLNYSG